jgi:hypothetical protein
LKPFKKITSLLIILVSLTNCKNESQKKKINSIFVRDWYDTEMVIPFSATLKINKDSTFQYKGGACTSSFTSNGTWRIENDTIILNSNKSKECLIIVEFGPLCPSKEDMLNHKISKTLKDCNPAGENMYENFRNEKFYIRNDSLIYKKGENEKCSEFEIIFATNKKKR